MEAFAYVARSPRDDALHTLLFELCDRYDLDAIVMADEPTASLDADNRRTVLELLAEARDRGAAIVGIFHDRAARRAICDREYPLTLEGPAA